MFLLSLSLSYEYSSKRRLHVIYSFVKDYLECERPHIEIYATFPCSRMACALALTLNEIGGYNDTSGHVED